MGVGLEGFLGGYMAKQRIPRVTPMMLREQPDQFTEIINRIIDVINES